MQLLDSVSQRLLAELQHDARISFAELGRRVGLTTPAVIEPVRKMEDSGIIRGYRVDIDPAKIGLPIAAFIRTSVVGNVFDRLVKVVKNSPEILECHRGTGSDSFIMRVAVTSVEELEDLIDRLTPFGTTSTSITLSTPLRQRPLAPRMTSRRK